MVKWKSVNKGEPDLKGHWKTKQLILKTAGDERYLFGYYSMYLGYLAMDSRPVKNVTHYSELD